MLSEINCNLRILNVYILLVVESPMHKLGAHFVESPCQIEDESVPVYFAICKTVATLQIHHNE